MALIRYVTLMVAADVHVTFTVMREERLPPPHAFDTLLPPCYASRYVIRRDVTRYYADAYANIAYACCYAAMLFSPAQLPFRHFASLRQRRFDML